MSAAAPRRAPLELVPHPDPAAADSEWLTGEAAAMLIPVVLTIANKTGFNRKRMLMPLCVAVMTSGMMTLIASSPNIIVQNALREPGVNPPLGFFSFTPFGVVSVAISIVFMLLVGAQPIEPKAFREDRNRITKRCRRHRFLRSGRAVASVTGPRQLAADRSVGGRGATTATLAPPTPVLGL